MAETDVVAELAGGIASGDRRALSRAITLIESARAEDRGLAEALLEELAPRAGKALRLGVSGPPGVGKSTLIDALGMAAIARGKKVAVLAIDPSSHLTGGSILGDKTRMARLEASAQSFIRPSPARGESGGLAPRTREAILVCEAFGFELVIVETVGVGQAEIAVADRVDCLLLLVAAGQGDELQGMKRGLLEHADFLAVTKADEDRVEGTQRAAAELRSALSLTAGTDAPPVFEVSAQAGTQIEELFSAIEDWTENARRLGTFEEKRRVQRRAWFRSAFAEELKRRAQSADDTQARELALEAAVERGEVSPYGAARELVTLLFGHDGR